MPYQVIDESAMPPAIDAAIRASLCVCFPDDRDIFSQSRAWHGSAASYSIVMEENGEVIAHVGIVDRTITAGETKVRVAGIQNVLVLPTQRGRGLCDTVMNAAMEEARKRDFDAGLLYCVPELEKVYARCGWTLLPKEEIVRIDETGQGQALPAKNIAMYYPLRVTDFPAGRIHLNGNDW